MSLFKRLLRVSFEEISKTMKEEQFKTEVRRRWGHERSHRSRNMAGLIFLVIGAVLLARASGVEFPVWMFSWPMILIMIGLYVGTRNGFRSPAPYILFIIGGVFLAESALTDLHLKPYLWPVSFILIGLFIIFRPRRKWKGAENHWSNTGETGEPSTAEQDWESTAMPDHNDVIDITTVFGGVKKKVLSKQFRGGDIVSIMGGTEVDLSQADFKGKVIIDNFTMFGGTKLIIPADWSVQSEAVAIFGGIDDKRPSAVNHDPSKIIFLEGTCLFGGIEIKSF
jgi:predicted membrane protein